MLLTLASLLMGPLLVFGIYHLLTWFNVVHINERIYWKRVAIASAISHLFLLTGFLIFSWFDFRNHARLEITDIAFGPYLIERPDFWRLMSIFDTLPMLAMLGLFWILDRTGVNPPGLLVATFAITYLAGTVQWFFIGGGIGAVLQKFWGAFKTGDQEDEEWM